jgi:hypothetical protein
VDACTPLTWPLRKIFKTGIQLVDAQPNHMFQPTKRQHIASLSALAFSFFKAHNFLGLTTNATLQPADDEVVIFIFPHRLGLFKASVCKERMRVHLLLQRLWPHEN